LDGYVRACGSAGARRRTRTSSGTTIRFLVSYAVIVFVQTVRVARGRVQNSLLFRLGIVLITVYILRESSRRKNQRPHQSKAVRNNNLSIKTYSHRFVFQDTLMLLAALNKSQHRFDDI
jgi:hypothetical protein